MSLEPRQIANWFVDRAQSEGRPLSIMSLLKLTYIAHGWHLQMRCGEPLFSNRIEAWQYGPVIPDVYSAFRNQGVNVTGKVTYPQQKMSDVDADLMKQIWDIYGRMSAFRLSDLTHEPGGQWHIASQMGGNYAPIPNDLIQKYYEMKRLKAAQVANG
jgi:uncharacterized phage-associated protein